MVLTCRRIAYHIVVFCIVLVKVTFFESSYLQYVATDSCVSAIKSLPLSFKSGLSFSRSRTQECLQRDSRTKPYVIHCTTVPLQFVQFRKGLGFSSDYVINTHQK